MNRSKHAIRHARIRSATAAPIERLEGRLFLSSTVLGNQVNLAATVAGITPQFDWLADLNGDSKADLIVANSSNSVSVLIGHGDGSFVTPAANYPVSGSPLPIAVADMTGDSSPDIVVGTTGSPGNVSILVNKGDGTFNPAINIPGLGSNHAIAVANFITGGNPDIVTVSNNATASNNMAIIFTDGHGNATAPATIFSAPHGSLSAVATGDFNGDTKQDIAVLSQADNTVTVLLGNGDGTFQAPHDMATGASPTSLAVGDFNGDGKLDIVTANSTSGTVSFLAGQGDGSFATKIDTHVAGSSSSGGPLKVRATNFNNDGKTDLFVLLSTGGTGDATVLLGQGNGTFQNVQPISTGGATRTGIATGDLNGDGLTDVVISDPTQVSSLLNVTTQDTIPPVGAVDASQLPGSEQSNVYQFTVTYTDAKQVDAQSLGNNDLVVTAPAGVTFDGAATTQAATLVSTGLVSGSTVHATYQVTFSSNLTASVNGTYQVAVNASSVFNAGGVAATAGNIGSFALAVSPSQPPPPPPGGGGGGTPPTPPTGDFTISAPTTGKPLSSVLTSSKQRGIKVTVTNTSGKLLTGKVVVTLFTSSTNLVVSGYGTFDPVAQGSKVVKKLKNGKNFVIRFPNFNYPATAGMDFLVASATLNGAADSNNGATASAITVAQAFVDVHAIAAAPVKPALVAGKKNSVLLSVENLGNIPVNRTATVDVFTSVSGVLDGTQTQIASAVPVTLHLKAAPGGKNVRVTFTPATLPVAGSYKLIFTINLVGDANTANNTVATTVTVTV